MKISTAKFAPGSSLDEHGKPTAPTINYFGRSGPGVVPEAMSSERHESGFQRKKRGGFQRNKRGHCEGTRPGKRHAAASRRHRCVRAGLLLRSSRWKRTFARSRPRCRLFRRIASGHGCRRRQHANWDSTAHMRMMLALEDEFGIDLDETQIMEITSYAKIRALVGDFRAATS